MKTVETKLFGKTYKFKCRDEDVTSCGKCNNGLIRTIEWRNGTACSRIWRCHCEHGQSHATHGFVKGEKTEFKSMYPIWNGDPTNLLNHKNWPKSPVFPKEADHGQEITQEKNNPGTGQVTGAGFDEGYENAPF